MGFYRTGTEVNSIKYTVKPAYTTISQGDHLSKTTNADSALANSHTIITA